MPSPGLTASRWSSAGNMVLRGLSLAARFALTIYIAKALGLGALGIFGVLAGVAGLAPSLLGFGVSYFTNRALVTLPQADGHLLLRDRTALSAAIALGVLSLAGAGLAFGLLPRPPMPFLMAAIVALEFIAFDLHVALITMGRAVAGNLLLAIRSSIWVPPAILLGILFPAMRSLEALLWWWLAALIVHFLVLGLMFPGADWRALARTPVDWRRLAGHARAAPLIYGNDVAANLQIYVERFIVLSFLGIDKTGIYTLFFSITHGVYTLTAAASTQMALPKLIAAETEGGVAQWRRTMASEARWTFAAALGLVLFVGFVALALLPRFGFPAFVEDAPLFLLMLGASLLKPMADLLLAAMYGLGLDRPLALINLGGAGLSFLAAVAFVAAFGLIGIGFAAITVQLGLIGVRFWWLRARWA